MKKKVHSYVGKDFYSRKDIAETYDSIRFKPKHGKLFNYAEKKVLFCLLKGLQPKKNSVLEIGSGTGRFSLSLAKRGFDVVASDISPTMQEVIRKKLSRYGKKLKGSVRLQIADAYNLPFDDDSFDVVICIRVLNQLKLDKDKKNALKEISRVLRPGGIAVLEYINASSLSIFSGTFQKMLKKRSMKPFRDSGLIRPYKMKRIIRDNGLVLQKTRGILLFSHTLYRILPEFLLKPVFAIDNLFARLLPFWCTRVYLKIRKRD